MELSKIEDNGLKLLKIDIDSYFIMLVTIKSRCTFVFLSMKR